MNINFVKPNRAFPNGYLEINDARIIWKNFSGRGDRFNREGDRNFHLVIPDQETCEALQNDKNEFGDSWNVKIKPPREAGDAPFMHMLVKVKFTGRGPNVYLVSGNKQVALNEDTIGCLDDIDILSVDLDVRPYDDKLPNGNSFRTAYLSAMRVHQRVDRFAATDDDYEDEKLPF
jgi:hypothetical protein